MLRISTLLVAIWAVLVHSLDAPIPGYTTVPITWPIDVFNNGTIYNLNGTIEQVYSQISNLNPDFPLPEFTTSTGSIIASIQDDWSPRCGGGAHKWERASRDPIYNGIHYLRKLSGQPSLGPGPGECSRVSCSWASAIWWCNDNDHTFTLPGYGTIADCAQMLYDQCSVFEDRGWYVLGQNFHRDHWNCIVRRDRDNC